MSKKSERISKMIDLLKVRNLISIKELSSIFGVSEMTIRRDLRILEQNRVAENVYGTTVYNPAHTVIKGDKEYELAGEEEKRNEQKERIGAFAASLVKPEEIVILDTGSTTERVAANLPNNRDLTVLCSSINLLMELRRNPGVKMVFAGGYYHPNTQMFECPEGIEFIRSLRAQKVFVSAAGVHSELGITCANNYEVAAKRAMLHSSLEKILVADSAKFGAVRPAYFCELSEINTVVTDSALPDEWRDTLRGLGITLHLV